MRLLADFISLIFPRYCLGCNESLYGDEQHVCLNCIANVSKTNSHCELENTVFKKLKGKVDVNFAWAYLTFQQSGLTQQFLHTIKYNGKKELATELGIRYGAEIKEHIPLKYDFLVPVPLHDRKLKLRGYNQSELFALGLSQALDIPVFNVLRRNVFTQTQTAKSRIKRFENVSQIFSVNEQLPNGCKIILVDDVITTGSTLESCIGVLKEHGCSVSVICLAAAK